jgi:hypothetical protein
MKLNDRDHKENALLVQMGYTSDFQKQIYRYTMVLGLFLKTEMKSYQSHSMLIRILSQEFFFILLDYKCNCVGWHIKPEILIHY